MQQELDSEYPEFDISIVGVNAAGLDFANEGITNGRDLPWLQDVDSNENGLSDVWDEQWDVEYRDVVILNGSNERVGVYNLTVNNLAEPAQYEELRAMLVDAAISDLEQPYQPGDANRDFRFDQRDLVLVLRAESYQTGEPATWEEGDWNRDGVFDRLDVVAALTTGNYLAGPYA